MNEGKEMAANQWFPEASPNTKPATAKIEAGTEDGECLVKLGGDWLLSKPVPSWSGVLGAKNRLNVRVVPEDLGKWDTSLVLFLLHGSAWCAEAKKEINVQALAENLQALLKQVSGSGTSKPSG